MGVNINVTVSDGQESSRRQSQTDTMREGGKIIKGLLIH